MTDSNPADHAAQGRHAIVITGMHRSGTSALSRALTSLGYAQPTDLMLPQQDNLLGFWESRGVVDLNDEILEFLELRWDEPGLPVVDHCDVSQGREVIAILLRRRFAERAAQLISSVYPGERTIVVKDPRISLLLQFWQEVLGGLGFRASHVHLFRHPTEVAKSLATRNGMETWRAEALWIWYNLTALTSGVDQRLLNYQNLLADPVGVVQALARAFNCEQVDIPPSERTFLKHFVSAGHRHHLDGDSPNGWGPLVSAIVKKLHLALLAGEADSTGGKSALADLRSELEQHLLFSGRATPVKGAEYVEDFDIHLLADGVRLSPERVNETYIFQLSKAPDELRLVSRAGQAVGPDLRRLGLAVIRLELDGRNLISEPAVLSAFDGWHEAEDGLRWTDGSAGLPPAAGEIRVTVAGGGRLIFA